MNRQWFYLGTWPTRRAARIAYDRAALYFRVVRARLNYPAQSRRMGPAAPRDLVREARLLSKNHDHRSSRFLGVSWNPRTESWEARAMVGSRERTIGKARDENLAALVRDQVVLHEQGRAAILNFPESQIVPRSLADAREFLKLRGAKDRRATGKYRGVWEAPNGRTAKWIAMLALPGRKGVYLGYWRTAPAAALAYDRAVLYYARPASYLNFPELRERLCPADAATLSAEARQVWKKHASSRFLGVYWFTPAKLWAAMITVHRNRMHLGYFHDEEDAARAYDRKARKLLGRKARLNFDPVTGEELCGRRLDGGALIR